MKKKIKLAMILGMILCVFYNLNTVYAENPKEDKKVGMDILDDTTTAYWNPNKNKVDDTELQEKAERVVAIIRNVGITISLVSLMIIGLREMTASAEEKSIIKQAMLGYVVGAIMVGAISTLPSIIYQLTKEVFK